MAKRKNSPPSKPLKKAKKVRPEIWEWLEKIKIGHFFFSEIELYLVEISLIVGLIDQILRGPHK